MYYDEHKLSQISNEIHNIYNLYREDYELIKKNKNMQNYGKIIWCKGWMDPYNSDYISEIGDCTIEERKILKKTPSNKEYTSKHMFDNEMPIFSLYFGETGQLTYEKFFINNSKKIIGVIFDSKTKQLFGITVEYFNDDGYVIEYNSAHINNTDMIIEGRKYYYNNGCIIKAVSMGGYKSGVKIIRYDDSIYKNIGAIISSDYPQMNPMLVHEYEFVYGSDGLPESYIRTSYSYGKKHIHTWKMKKSLIKKYMEYGINTFNQNRL